jgi:hypothetical protein
MTIELLTGRFGSFSCRLWFRWSKNFRSLAIWGRTRQPIHVLIWRCEEPPIRWRFRGHSFLDPASQSVADP